MKKSKFSEEQITYALRQAEAGAKVEEICRQLGVSKATFFNWKKKFGGMGVSELRRLRQLEEENAQLKKLVADLSLDRQILKDVIKKVLRPKVKKKLIIFIMAAYQVAIRRACAVLPMHRSVFYYKQHKREEALLLMRMKEIAFARIRYGFRRIEIMLCREGFRDNHKRMRRVYCEQGLNLRQKRHRRHRSVAQRLERIDAGRVHQVWGMDFVADQLFNGKRFRILTVIDNFSRKSLGLIGQPANQRC